jgi:hypothetical protein
VQLPAPSHRTAADSTAEGWDQPPPTHNPRTRHSPDAHTRPTHRARRHTRRTGTTDHHVTRTAHRGTSGAKGGPRGRAHGGAHTTSTSPVRVRGRGQAQRRGSADQAGQLSRSRAVRPRSGVRSERMQVVVVRVPVGSHRCHTAPDPVVQHRPWHADEDSATDAVPGHGTGSGHSDAMQACTSLGPARGPGPVRVSAYNSIGGAVQTQHPGHSTGNVEAGLRHEKGALVLSKEGNIWSTRGAPHSLRRPQRASPSPPLRNARLMRQRS